MNERLFDELLEIASRICDETASEHDLKRLDEVISTEPDAAKVYSEFMSMHAEMYWHQDAVLLGSQASIRTKQAVPQPTGKWWLSLAATLVFGSCFGLVLAYWLSEEQRVINQDKIVAIAPDAEEVAVVSGTRNCRWLNSGDSGNTGDATVGYGSSLYSGQRLMLAEGLAEITFNKFMFSTLPDRES